MHTNDDFKMLCRENGWKCTVQRRSVFEYLNSNRLHPNVEMVWTNVRKKLPDVSLDSIYRILGDFSAAGLVRRLESGKTFRYDINTEIHDHFVCSECGSIFDFKHVDAGPLEQECQAIGKVQSFELEVKGICNACLAGRRN